MTVVLFHNPKALIPRPPFIPWLFNVAALGAFAMVLALGLEDGWAEDDEVDHAQRWKAAALAYVAGVIATLPLSQRWRSSTISNETDSRIRDYEDSTCRFRLG